MSLPDPNLIGDSSSRRKQATVRPSDIPVPPQHDPIAPPVQTQPKQRDLGLPPMAWLVWSIVAGGGIFLMGFGLLMWAAWQGDESNVSAAEEEATPPSLVVESPGRNSAAVGGALLNSSQETTLADDAQDVADDLPAVVEVSNEVEAGEEPERVKLRVANKEEALNALASWTDAELLAFAEGAGLPDRFAALDPREQQQTAVNLRAHVDAEVARRWVDIRDTGIEIPPHRMLPEHAEDDALPMGTRVKSIAYSGVPFGVGAITLTFPDTAETNFFPDQLPRLSEASNRTFYPAFDIERNDDGNLRQVTARFLFQGDGPLDVALRADKLTRVSLTPVDGEITHADERNAAIISWWRVYRSQRGDSRTESATTVLIENYLQDMLARRMRLPAGSPRKHHLNLLSWEIDEATERTLSMLTGTASIDAALGYEQRLATGKSRETLSQALPAAVSPPAVRIPDGADRGEVEPIALHVPAECYYVRCRTFSNYLWLRDFIDSWGGSVGDLMAMQSIDYGIRRRLERQLALAPDASARLFLDKAISDMAIIGADINFDNGAAVGILMQAKHDGGLTALIRMQRNSVLHSDETAREREVDFGSGSAQLLTTQDGSVRSYYAVSGSHHLVTTSSYIVRRFFEASRLGKDALGRLDEFRYARAKISADRGDQAFFYLSDPFFRLIVGPKYRVEMARRRQALADIRLAELALLAAKSEGIEVHSLAELIAKKYLPPGFGPRSDGSRTMIRNGRPVDSHRGRQSSLVPIVDMRQTLLTRSEVRSYQEFAREYNAQWSMAGMDPVIIAVSTADAARADCETVAVDFVITPYSPRVYDRSLVAMLVPSTERVEIPAGYQIAAEANLRCVSPYEGRLYAGIKDVNLPLRIERGEMVPLVTDDVDLSTVIQEDYIGAHTPKDADTKRDILREMFDNFSLEFDAFDAEGYAKALLADEDMARLVGDMLWWRNHDELWNTLGRSRESLAEVTDQLRLTEEQPPAQVRLTVGDVNEHEAGRLIDSVAYLHARHLSATNTRLLWQLEQQFHVPADATTVAAENVAGGVPVCPLGGKYRASGADGLPPISTAWTQSSVYQVRAVPHDYKFAFTDWLRGLTVDFHIDRNTLTTHLELTVRNAPSEK